MTYTYNITSKNQFKALGFSFFLILFFSACIIFFGSQKGYDSGLFGFFGIVSAILIGPVLYLHCEYSYYNRNTKLIVDTNQNQFTYTDSEGNSESHPFNDVDKIEIYMFPSTFRRSSFQLFPFEPYHYARIFLKSGKEIIITCLMAQSVEDALRDIQREHIQRKPRVFTSIKLH